MFWSIVGGILVLSWIGLMIWSWVSPVPETSASQKRDRDQAIGVMVGASGGDVSSAAEVRYAVDRLEQELGRPATRDELMKAVGAELGMREALRK